MSRSGDVVTITGTANKVGTYKLITSGSDWGGNPSVEKTSTNSITINPTTLLASDVTWGSPVYSGAIASVTLTKNSNVPSEYTLQYMTKKNNAVVVDWTKMPSNNTITNIADNTVIYARFVVYDNNNVVKFYGAEGSENGTWVAILANPIVSETGITGSSITYNVEWSKTSNAAKITFYTDTGFNMKYSLNNGASWTEIASGAYVNNIPNNQVIQIKFKIGSNESDPATFTLQDSNKPTVTVNSLTSLNGQKGTTLSAQIQISDSESGPNYNSLTYIFKCTDQNGTTTNTNASYVSRSGDVVTVSGTASKVGTYQLITSGSDWGGNPSGEITSTQTVTINPTTLLASDVSWGYPVYSGAVASVTLTKNSNVPSEYTLQYMTKKNNAVVVDWTKMPSNNTITNIADDTTIYARFVVYDRNNVVKFTGSEGAANATLRVVDETGPVNTISPSSNRIIVSGNNTITISATDAESGVTNLWYKVDTSSSNISAPSKGVAVGDAWTSTNTTGYITSRTFTTTNGTENTFNVNVASEGSYYVHVLSKDACGNYSSSTSEQIVVRSSYSLSKSDGKTGSQIYAAIQTGLSQANDYYGRDVTNYISNAGTEQYKWKIFHIDSNGRIYLIASNAVRNVDWPSPNTISIDKDGDYKGGFKTLVESAQLEFTGSLSKVTSGLRGLLSYGAKENQNNMKVVEYLMWDGDKNGIGDTGWTEKFGDGNKFADMAMGAPTLDLVRDVSRYAPYWPALSIAISGSGYSCTRDCTNHLDEYPYAISRVAGFGDFNEIWRTYR